MELLKHEADATVAKVTGALIVKRRHVRAVQAVMPNIRSIKTAKDVE
jgi:chaperonin cofactor prefoldin